MRERDNYTQTPSTFSRNLKHLDQTATRERHKVAVVYVGLGQEVRTFTLQSKHPIHVQTVTAM